MMCWMCDRQAKMLTEYWASDTIVHFKAYAAAALTADGVGDGLKTGPLAPALIVTTDDVPDSITATNPTVTVDGAHIISTIDTMGDQDFFKVELTAGVTYEIGQYGYVGGPNGVPLADAYIELYDSAGNLITANDGGGETPGGQVYGLDALLTYQATATGTYYINARAFDMPEDGEDTGDSVGDYELFVRTSAYTPYYELDSPLHSLDWGTQVNKMHQSVRNPDGQEGPRPTGNSQEDPGPQAGTPPGFAFDISGKNVITYYFAEAGEIYHDSDPTTPGSTDTIVAKGLEAWEKEAYRTAMAEFSKVADIVYIEVTGPSVYDELTQTAAADFTFITYLGTPGPGVSLLGRMAPPDTDNEGQSEFNANDERWNEEGLARGGFSFVTLIHEMGHGHGMAHPHDNGGRSSIMRGVTQETPTSVFNYTTGDYDLNQGVHTMMSYEDGWQTSPYGNAPTTAGYGYLGGLMAFDIAVIQDKYGVNEDWATGDDVYTLKDVNAAGTFFTSIWDAGGIDVIEYVGTRDTTIDLRAATLQYEVGGGGFMSYAYGIFGGFTIANGVTIENVTTDGGKDVIFDNAADNALTSGAGNDAILAFGGGTDTIGSGAGNDFIYFGAAFGTGDGVDGGSGTDTLSLLGAYTMTFGASQLTGIERLVMYSGSQNGAAHNSYNLTMDDGNVAAGAMLAVVGRALLADEQIIFNGVAESDGFFFFNTGLGNDILVGGAQGDSFTSSGGDDQLFGQAGDDWFHAGLGADDLRGGAGFDRFVYKDAAESTGASTDNILDFQSGTDRLDLSTIDANGNAGDGDTAFTFIGAAAFSNVAGQLRAYQTAGGWFVEGDINGDGTADLVIEVDMAGAAPLLSSDIAL